MSSDALLLNRRRFLHQSMGGALSTLLASGLATAANASPGDLQLSTFRFDVTPPLGHGCCGGWIKPVVGYDDPLEAVGLVISGAGKPVVLCAVDWTGLLNSANTKWREALADAAGTTPDRVAVQCVHQHNAPFVCLESQKLVEKHADLPSMVDVGFYNQCLDRGHKAVTEAVANARPLTHIAVGQAKVDKVAANRRVMRDADGNIVKMRGSRCADKELRALPEGTIDPWLKTVAFYDGPTKLAACHYYATHPMSYYGDGRVSSDFPGLARKMRQKEEPDTLHLYFTGASGNVAAGKYNDGSKEMRPILRDRIYRAMVDSEKNLKEQPIETVTWKTADLLPTPKKEFTAEVLDEMMKDTKRPTSRRNIAAYRLEWLRRCERQEPLVLSSLSLGKTTLLHLPAESFIEYQLKAQEMAKDQFLATAAYGDGGPWYLPIAAEYPLGGYEVSVAFCEPTIDEMMSGGCQSMLS
ncbi:hypothetical protein Pan216_44640 [Planctomycetes bacterium Pan216]|uniref:Neutral/alkaline non-lysosomal ceramidase n=1 Tax=Kolteria novifilia TaxID=2527975 RepID=A0A518B9J1_9BACT|nr:hypothetical protein Pan216_44640 [Planctomycetes bacterium Pan216]